MDIKELISKASTYRSVAELMEMLEEDYDIVFENTEFCNEANIELMLSDVDGYVITVHLFPLNEMIDDEEAIDDFMDYCDCQDWGWIDDNIEGMYLIVSEENEPYRTICDYKNFGYTEAQAEALLLRAF